MKRLSLSMLLTLACLLVSDSGEAGEWPAPRGRGPSSGVVPAFGHTGTMQPVTAEAWSAPGPAVPAGGGVHSVPAGAGFPPGVAGPAVGSGVRPDPRWYLGGMLGAAIPESENFQSPRDQLNVHYDVGFASGATVGYLFNVSDRFDARVEGEFRFLHSGVESGDLNVADVSRFTGESETSVGMVNFLFDMNHDLWWGHKHRHRFIPYAGVGVGFANIDQDFRFDGDRLSDEDQVFAGQAIAGLTYKVREDLDLFVDSRFLWTADPSYRAHIDGVPVSLEGNHESVSVMFGLRIYLDNLPIFGPPWERPKGPHSDSLFRPEVILPGGP